jgi:hypothetical protein
MSIFWLRRRQLITWSKDCHLKFWECGDELKRLVGFESEDVFPGKNGKGRGKKVKKVVGFKAVYFVIYEREGIWVHRQV